MPNQHEDQKVKGKKQERRNGHAFHPIMSKGGVHEKTEKAKRKGAKHEMKRKVNEWFAGKGGPETARLNAQESSPKHTTITLH